MSKIEHLISAIRDGNDPDMVRLLKEVTMYEINSECAFRNTITGRAIHAACFVNNATALATLLRMDGINVNPAFNSTHNVTRNTAWYGIYMDQDYDGFTPIMIAAAKKHKESFKLLVQDDRVNLKTATLRDGEECGLPEIFKDTSKGSYDMLVQMLAAITTELDVLRDLSTNLGELLESGEMSDFKIVCKGEVFPCHKYILLARSNVLRTMVNNDMKESNEGTMTITDLEPAIVKIIIKFIYTGKVAIDDLKANLTQLLEVAELTGLTKLCEDQLVLTIDNNNVLDIIVMADLYHANILREAAMKWIVAKQFEIVKQEGWKEVLIKLPNLLIDIFDALSTKP